MAADPAPLRPGRRSSPARPATPPAVPPGRTGRDRYGNGDGAGFRVTASDPPVVLRVLSDVMGGRRDGDQEAELRNQSTFIRWRARTNMDTLVVLCILL